MDRHCARHRTYSDHELSSLHKYFVFQMVINVLPYHLTVMQSFPVGPTKCIMRYRFCQRRNQGVDRTIQGLGLLVGSRYILYEDVKMYTRIQEGIEKSSQAEHPLHEQERVAHFHESLRRWVEQLDP